MKDERLKYKTYKEAKENLPVMVQNVDKCYPYKIIGNKKYGFGVGVKASATYEDFALKV